MLVFFEKESTDDPRNGLNNKLHVRSIFCGENSFFFRPAHIIRRLDCIRVYSTVYFRTYEIKFILCKIFFSLNVLSVPGQNKNPSFPAVPEYR